MQKQNSKLAFSLIELSIVILIIGILVIGISKSSRIISSARLASAKTLTKGSPVNLNAQNLVFWIDASSEGSFNTNETSNGVSITAWNDINPNAGNSPFNFTPSATAPTYLRSSTNGLPGVKFNNSSVKKINVPATLLTQSGNQVTYFVVQKHYLTSVNIASTVMWQNGGSRIGGHFSIGDGTFYFDFGVCCGIGRLSFTSVASDGKPVILSYVKRPNNVGIARINGQEYQRSTTMSLVQDMSIVADFFIADDGMVGEVNEVIFFKTGLSDAEMASIEKYLSNKWGIPLK